MGGQILGAVGQHLGVGGRQLPGGQGLGGSGQGATKQGPGGAHEAGGGAGPHAQPAPEPGGGGAGLHAVFGAGGAAGVQVGEFGEPLAFQALHQPPQGQDPFGPAGVGQPANILGGQALELGHHRC
jgi:hypothetical protein